MFPRQRHAVRPLLLARDRDVVIESFTALGMLLPVEPKRTLGRPAVEALPPIPQRLKTSKDSEGGKGEAG